MGKDQESSCFLQRLLMGLWDLQLTGFCSSSWMVLEEYELFTHRNNAYHHTSVTVFQVLSLLTGERGCFITRYLVAKKH